MKIGHGWLDLSACGTLSFFFLSSEGCLGISETRAGENSLFPQRSHLLNIGTNPPPTEMQSNPTPTHPPGVCLGTDLSVQVDVGDAVEGELVAVAAVLVDVGDGQAGQLPHRSVVAGDGGELGGRKREPLAAHGRKQAQQAQQQRRRRRRCSGGAPDHGWRSCSGQGLRGRAGRKSSLLSGVCARPRQRLLEPKQGRDVEMEPGTKFV